MITHALVLHGRTYDHKFELKNMGFVWHPDEKAWWRGVLPYSTELQHLQRKVKTMRGVSSSIELIDKFQRRSPRSRF